MSAAGQRWYRRTLPARVAVAIWLAFVLACAVVAARTTFTADLSAFLPRAPTAEQQLLVDQLRDGLVSRLLLIGIEGGAGQDQDGARRAALSKALAGKLRGDPRFAAIDNGEPVNRERDQRYLFANRYLLSPAVTPERFTEAGLRAAVGDTIDLLGSSAGLMIKPLLPRDPTGEVATLLADLDPGHGAATRDGVWASRDGRRAVLLAQTAAPGSDLDAQAQAMAAIRSAFAAAVSESGAKAGEFRLVMSGPGAIGVQTRDTIRAEVERLSTIGVAVIVALLWFVYRSPTALALGLVPVLSGVLAGVAAVSLGFGMVHGLTLGFGTTLIGESVDYAIYLFAQTAQDRDDDAPAESGTAAAAAGAGAGAAAISAAGFGVGVGSSASTTAAAARERWTRAFWPTVRLGVLTSICGFASLLLSGFPGLAQLGLFSIAGLATAALVTRFVLPQLIPARWRMRDLRPLGNRLARIAAHAPRLRWPALAVVLAAVLVLVWLVAVQRTPLWSQELTSLSPVPADTQALDTGLRADLGAPDVRYLVTVSAATEQGALQGAEQVGAQLAPLVAQGVIGGFDSPARFLPSEATQRARQAALPSRDELAGRLEAAVAELPVKPALFAPFLDEVARVREMPPLTRADLRGTSMALAVDALLTEHGGRWTATLPLRAPAQAIAAPGADPDAAADAAPNADADAPAGGQAKAGAKADASAHAQSAASRAPAAVPVPKAIRAAIARAGVANALFVDLKGESDRLYAGYLREALRLSLGGAAAIAMLLLVALRSPRRVLATLLPLAAAALVVIAGLALAGKTLSLLHLVGMLLLVAVGSNYALFFNGAARTPDASERGANESGAHEPRANQPAAIAPRTLVSLLLANLTTVAAFGLLGLSHLPLLQAFGQTVGPGAVLALLFSAVFAPAAMLGASPRPTAAGHDQEAKP
ncbi:MMPL family transporter [Cupriavidus gilardii]|uniref:MMPL family transporter n=1 Tax=Cupriavidus gilardii TaxID=82541 RepID=A0A849BQJ9_9BURK|nr:MMPL family transporter [Cupriavidus gilardii]KAB0599310.1 MMPL family transporter [Cupriavidus gilardii]MCT9013217.1 MMPL family transporter [Cupriavidus gilardii]MCT9052771.1 MMPL family transporter [Cupriavidus gilardii]NNH12809.1 MMPL family transporter [Cupriavidus gilardii]WNG67903.1 MMPL family transporter [Cupriavidus gilardii]